MPVQQTSEEGGILSDPDAAKERTLASASFTVLESSPKTNLDHTAFASLSASES